MLHGVVGSDAVSLVTSGAAGAFSDKNAGTAKSVSTSGFSINGADIANYTLVQPSLTANITRAGVSVSGVVAGNKVYNGTTSATVNGSGATLSGVISGDNVSLNFSSAAGTFDSKNIGTSKPVTISGITLGGTDGGNYNLTQPASSANITAATLTVSGVTAANKVYDGTVQAALNTSGAVPVVVYGSDNVVLNSSGATAVFSDKNTGTAKQLIVSGFTISGTDAFNYILTQPSLTASITARTLTVTANSISKPYMTTITFTGNEYTYTGLVSGDLLPSFDISSPGAQPSAMPGEYVITISGGALPNYSIVHVNGILSVGKNLLTARADSKTRTYGSQNPVFTITYTGFLNGDNISDIDNLPSASTTATLLSAPGSYAISLSGGSDDVYNIVLVNGTLDIQKAALTVKADDKEKVYGEPTPDLTIVYSGFVQGQGQEVLDVKPSVTSSVTDISDAGEYEISVSGGYDDNYAFIYVPGTFTVSKIDEYITFDDLPESARMSQQVILQASSSSGLPVRFELSGPGKATITGDVMTLTGDGKITVTAVQEGDINHNPAVAISHDIDVLPTFDNISSLFTPNGDGMNDYWYIPGLEEYGKVEVTVYNRYGQPVYHSSGYKNDWDGTWNGHPLPSASYYYLIRSSAKGPIKGVVNIVR